MTKSARRARKKRMAQETLQGRKGPRCDEPMDPFDLSGPETDREEEDDPDILFPARAREPEELVTQPSRAQETIDCDIVNMVKTLNGAIAAISQDTARIQRAYRQLFIENTARNKALADLTAMVREYGSSPDATRPYDRSQETTRSHPTIQADVMGGRTTVFTTGVSGTGHVYTLSTRGRRRPKGLIYDGSTGHTGDT